MFAAQDQKELINCVIGNRLDDIRDFSENIRDTMGENSVPRQVDTMIDKIENEEDDEDEKTDRIKRVTRTIYNGTKAKQKRTNSSDYNSVECY